MTEQELVAIGQRLRQRRTFLGLPREGACAWRKRPFSSFSFGETERAVSFLESRTRPGFPARARFSDMKDMRLTSGAEGKLIRGQQYELYGVVTGRQSA